MWLTFKELQQIFVKHQKGDLLHLLRHMVPTNIFSTRSLVQKRLSIYNWNPRPPRRKEDAFEKQIAVKWHIITLQETSDMSIMTFLQVGST